MKGLQLTRSIFKPSSIFKKKSTNLRKLNSNLKQFRSYHLSLSLNHKEKIVSKGDNGETVVEFRGKKRYVSQSKI